MRERLKENLKNSYSPYSNFKVSAIVKMKDGNTFSGVNIENASYSATICAERCAIFNAISNGYKKGDFKELYLMFNNNSLSTPCFICRQVIEEFFDEEDKIIIMNDKEEREFLVKELCTYPFNEEDLK